MDEDNGADDACFLMSILEHNLGEVIVNFSENLQDSALSICNEAADLLNMLEQAKELAGKVDIRRVNNKGLTETISKFLEKAATKDSQSNNSNCKAKINMLKKTTVKLSNVLLRGWNVILAPQQQTGEKSSVASASTGHSENDPWGFYNADDESKESHYCEDCQPPRHFTCGKAFGVHMKKKHSKTVKVVRSTILCRLPHSRKTRALDRHPRDQVASHLLKVHKIPKPSKDHYFCGWLTRDGGLTFEPIFIKDGDPLPTKESHPVGPQNQSDRIIPAAAGAPGDVVPAVADVPVVDDVTEMGAGHLGGGGGGLAEDIGAASADGNEAGGTEGDVSSQLSLPADLVLGSNRSNMMAPSAPTKDVEVIEANQETSPSAANITVIVQTGPEMEDLASAKTQAKIDICEDAGAVYNLLQPETVEPMDVSVAVAVPEKEGADQQGKEDEDEAEDRLEANTNKQDDERDIEAQMLLEDEFYNSNPDNLDSSNQDSRSQLKVEEDSDGEEDDSAEFERNRLMNKSIRYKARGNIQPHVDIAEQPETKKFEEELLEYVASNSSNGDRSGPTISFTRGLLIHHSDSWLRYEYARNPEFSLDRLLCFNDEERFLELRDPTPWIQTIAGADNIQQPSRRKEMYKASRRLRDFVEHKLKHDSSIGTSLEAMIRRDKIKDNLKEITEDINKKHTYSVLDKQIALQKKKLDQAKQVLSPNASSNAAEANRVYFQSEPYKVRAEKHTKVWEKAVSTNKIGVREFNLFGNFVRHITFFYDRNRQSCYNFTNSDYFQRQAVFFPDGHNQDSFDGIPDGHDMFKKPMDGRNPDGYVIKVLGSAKKLKLQEDAHITIFKTVESWMMKYRDLKDLLIGSLDPDEVFFVNCLKGQRKPFGPMNNTPGSILEEYSAVTNQERVTTTKIRGSLEQTVQGNHSMRTRSKVISQHSAETGTKYYDKSAAPFRLSSMHFITNQEGLNEVEEETEVSDEVAAKRRKLNDEDQASKLEKARELLQKEAGKKRQQKIGVKGCKIAPEHRSFLQQTFSQSGQLSSLGHCSGKFPSPQQFRKSFYRVIDGGNINLDQENLVKMKEIEALLFATIKETVVLEYDGVWENSYSQNKSADLAVATAIHTSFKYYERNTKTNDKKYFTF